MVLFEKDNIVIDNNKSIENTLFYISEFERIYTHKSLIKVYKKYIFERIIF